MPSANNQTNIATEVNRRNFLRGSSVAAMMAMLGGIPLKAADQPDKAKRGLGPPIKCAVIGCGQRGREILTALAEMKSTPQNPGDPPVATAPVIAVCDTWGPFVRRGKEITPEAEGFGEYKEVLANKEVQAVFVATPTHLHKQIVIDALAAGKHVYCEAPLAHTIEDARAIAQAANAAEFVNFQPGLQLRSDRLRQNICPYCRRETIGELLKVHAQWHKKESWRRSGNDPVRVQERNWRLARASSPGLIGEVGIHQIDMVNWFLVARPVAVTGYGGILQWKNEPDRQVPDTIQAVFEYASGANFNYEATLGNSRGGVSETFYGGMNTLVFKSNLGWIFREVDTPVPLWEMGAFKEPFHGELGFPIGYEIPEKGPPKKPEYNVNWATEQLASALEAFIGNTNLIIGGTQDFNQAYGDKPSGLKDYLANLRKGTGWFKAATYRDAFEANVIALKANEAILEKKRIVFQKEWFEI